MVHPRQLRIEGGEIGSGRKNAAGAAHSEDLKAKRKEGGQVDEAEAAEKEPAGEEAIARAVVAVEEVIEAVKRLGHECLDGNWGRCVVERGLDRWRWLIV